ncbi:MAG: cobalamin-binding protein [Bacteroidetes bacterium]|nr:MAG: cobalamin-binding protein [Bacteroidota bacterium]
MSERRIQDQMGREVSLKGPVKRVVSIVPSQTEFLYDLGLEEEVVGITKFCIHPESWYRSKTRVGGTKKLDFEKIRALNPDLIIGNKEENTQEEIELLEKEFPLWMSDIVSLEDALQMMTCLGEILDRKSMADHLVSKIRSAFEGLSLGDLGEGRMPSVLYLIWNKPMMAAGEGTFIHEMIQRAGFENVLEGKNRYPVIEEGACEPDYVFLSTEPYPFGEKDLEEMKQFFPKASIHLVDGEMFSWYGSRLMKTADYFRRLKSELKN